MLRTYDPKKVLVSLGTHSVTGYSDGTFVTAEASGDGTSKKVGCDGEVIRSIDPDGTGKVTLTVHQQSPTVAFCQRMYDRDRNGNDGTFPILIRDLRGGLLFSARDAWVVKPPTREFGKESADREIEIDCGDVEWKGENTR